MCKAGRPSKLTERQWDEIQRRLVMMEPAADLARAFGISPARISRHCAQRVKEIRALAFQLIEAERALEALPPWARRRAEAMVDKLKATCP